ncbi:MAG: UDP-3-O-acyl-N-acetylglucosamine deacetylase [Armatimonadota bacterium]|nr:UDP-3-O-acyl-N-acetylglucosamine deacetylase [Armatimonadota bacterium]
MSTEPARRLRTLRQEAPITGVGLHSGQRVTARLRPSDRCGIIFVRIDLPEAPEVPASRRCVAHTVHATTLKQNGVTVSTTEHLMAALWAMDVTNCRIELDGPEVPILDGSAQGWCRLIEEAGVAEVPAQNTAIGSSGVQRPLYALREPVWVSEGKGSVLGLPHTEFRLTVAVDYDIAYIGPQMVDVLVTPANFVEELAPARTFTVAKWIEPLRAQGLIRGGSTENAVILWPDAPSVPWRMENELARHKALDVVGDVALLFGDDGGALRAHLIAIRAGHGLHLAWMEECVRRNALIRL